MQNSDSQKPSNLEESKEKEVEINKQTEINVDDTKKSKLNESNAQVIRVLQNSNAQTGKYELFGRSIVFDAIRTL